MTNLSTHYMGIPLRNPIIIGSSSLVNDLNMLKKLEEAGAAAVVYKSLFEEQIHLESIQMEDEMTEFSDRNAEMGNIFPKLQHAGPQEYLLNLRKAKSQLGIPLIASLNCIYTKTWLEYAKLIEKTGVDGLELNFYAVPRDFDSEAKTIEDQQVALLRAVKKVVSIPVSIKLSPFYTNVLNLISRMDKAGANGFVLFNRLFEPDINIEDMKHSSPFNLSHEGDGRLAIRYAGILFDKVEGSVCSNTGIYGGNDVVKMLLAGADCVQIVSTIYKHKPEYIATMLSDIETWMKAHKFGSVDEFKGLLSRKNTANPYIYKRAQYIEILMSGEEVLKKHLTI
ncbi:MAG TPA: dihydroorotate dehydrogenase-like protein [Bacteroidales bacterium]